MPSKPIQLFFERYKFEEGWDALDPILPDIPRFASIEHPELLPPVPNSRTLYANASQSVSYPQLHPINLFPTMPAIRHVRFLFSCFRYCVGLCSDTLLSSRLVLYKDVLLASLVAMISSGIWNFTMKALSQSISQLTLLSSVANCTIS
jgi:hypothetical protein